MKYPKRAKMEPSKLRSIRMPARIWDLLDKASARHYRSANIQIKKLIEDFLVEEGLLDDKDRGTMKLSEIEKKGG